MPTDVKISQNQNNIQVSLNRPSQQDNRNIQVDINKEPPKPKISVELNLRKSLDGNLMILDHRDLDIVVMPAKSKIMAFAKDATGDHIYDSQDRLFKFLVNKGVVERESVQGGNIYYSMEAKIPASKQHNMIENVVLTISKFIDKERPYYEYEHALEKEMEKRLADPSPEESTEFDPDRHAEKKGSLSRARIGLTAVYRM